jgi:CBS domain-containing protein
MQVRDVMTTPAVTIRPQATYREIVDTLLAHDISGVPVVDGGGRLLGIVSEADLLSRAAYGHRTRRPLALLADYLCGRDPQWVRKAAGDTAADLMNAAPQHTTPDADLGDAARWLIEDRHRRLPVVDDGKVVGIVSRHDLLEAQAHQGPSS